MIIVESLWALGAVAFLGLTWTTLGFRLLRPVRAGLGAAETLALSVLAGAGAEAVGLFLVGQLWFSALTVAVCAAAGLLPMLPRAERTALAATFRALEPPRSLVWLVLAPALLVLVLASLARPVGNIGHDGISYHLLGPAMWLRHGRIEPVLDMSHTAFPAVVELLFGAGMALANERAPGVVGLLLGSAVVVQAAGLVRWLGAGAAWAAAAALLVATMPALTDLVTVAFVDLEYAGFVLAAVRLLLEDRASRGWFRVGALFLGLAMGTKYNGLMMAPITLALALVHRWRRSGAREAIGLAAEAAALAAVVALPFYLRNYLILGVPIYPPTPALARLGRPRAFPADASVDWVRYLEVRGRGFGRTAWDLALLPFRYTYHAHRFHGAGGIGVVPLAFFPAGLVRWRHRAVRYAVLWIGLNTLAWFFAQQESRFLAPVVILTTALAVAGASALARRHGRRARFAWVLALAISVAYGAAVLARTYVPAAASVLDGRRDEARWRERVPYADAFAYLNRMPAPCRVLILGPSPPPYFLHHDYVKLVGPYGERPVDGVHDLPAALAQLDQLAFTHVLDVTDGVEGFRVPAPAPPGLDLVFESTGARVYRVRR